MEAKASTAKIENETYFKKTYILKNNDKLYRLIVEIKDNEVLFELYSISEISYFNYIGKYDYNDIIKQFKISSSNTFDLIKIFNYIYLQRNQIIEEEEKNLMRIIINKQYEILLYKNKIKNDNMIEILINEINKEKGLVNTLIKSNEEKDNKIEDLKSNHFNLLFSVISRFINLESKIKKLENKINIINDIIIQKGYDINLIYECENNSLENIFGVDFVYNNKDNIELDINGKKNKLVSEYKLKKGENNIKLTIKNKLTNLSYMFNGCKSLKNIDELKYLNTSYCNDFSYMFNMCSKIEDFKVLENWNVSNGKNFSNMFSFSLLSKLEGLKNWDISNGKDFSGMFYGCQHLHTLEGLENWNISNGNNFSCMFFGCSGISEIKELGNWDVSNGTNFSKMFSYCTSLSNIRVLENWNVSNGKDFNSMFSFCSSLSDKYELKNWYISKDILF